MASGLTARATSVFGSTVATQSMCPMKTAQSRQRRLVGAPNPRPMRASRALPVVLCFLLALAPGQGASGIEGEPTRTTRFLAVMRHAKTPRTVMVRETTWGARAEPELVRSWAKPGAPPVSGCSALLQLAGPRRSIRSLFLAEGADQTICAYHNLESTPDYSLVRMRGYTLECRPGRYQAVLMRGDGYVMPDVETVYSPIPTGYKTQALEGSDVELVPGAHSPADGLSALTIRFYATPDSVYRCWVDSVGRLHCVVVAHFGVVSLVKVFDYDGASGALSHCALWKSGKNAAPLTGSRLVSWEFLDSRSLKGAPLVVELHPKTRLFEKTDGGDMLPHGSLSSGGWPDHLLNVVMPSQTPRPIWELCERH